MVTGRSIKSEDFESALKRAPVARKATETDWIVCHAETRPIKHGWVACPVGGEVPGPVCAACRHLVTSSAERTRDGWCAMGDPRDPGRADSMPRNRLARYR
jgi:hypothetical protein